MKHEELKAKILTFYDGGLLGTEREEVISHMEGCPECRGAYEKWKGIGSAFSRIPEPSPSESFVQKVMGRVQDLQEKGRDVLWPRFARWAFPAFTLALASFMFTLIYVPTESTASMESLLIAQGSESITSKWLGSSQETQEDQILGDFLEEQ